MAGLLSFDPAMVAPFFSVRDYTFPFPATVAAARLLPGNGQRVLIAWSNNSGIALFVRPHLPGAITQGIVLANQVPQTMEFANWGGVIQEPWYLGGTTAAGSLYVLEVLYTPPGD